MRTDEQASTDEVDAVEGKHFEVVTSSCLFQSGLIGECRASCSRDLAEVAFGVVAYGQDDEACPGQLKCCAHVNLLFYFYFLFVNSNNHRVIVTIEKSFKQVAISQ